MEQEDNKKYNRSYYLTKKEHEIMQLLIKLLRIDNRINIIVPKEERKFDLGNGETLTF